ncbi:HmuY family protein [Paraglaciecola sp. L3A3]|uniref:HmuY family protein n=1 Tax=Paraglaciecola sp. L3A3 TaxID=2686358 RepID=UPI00131C749A|nr:HmuY family protein [Paraglaciecola sp. L3A3]
MNNKFAIAVLSGSMLLTACGGSSSDDTNVIPEEPSNVYGPLATGSVAEPNYAYFDLETMTVVSLTEEQAATDTSWDIAFKRTGVYLNNANNDSPVTAYFTGNNTDFWDGETPVADKFLNATPETELAAFDSVSITDVPADTSMFIADEMFNIISDFYNYDPVTHQVSAADDKYFIVNSDDQLTKYRVSALTQVGFAMSDITLQIANQDDADLFGAESPLLVDLVTECGLGDMVYVDFGTATVVTENDNWDLSFICNEANTGSDFEMDIADDATALQDFTNEITGISAEALPYHSFKANTYTEKAFDATPWYAYNIEGGIPHGIYSQYGIYLIKTDSATYKLQMLSYYDEESTSGSISFRTEALVAQ